MTFCSFFCGGGGIDMGFNEAGFKCVFACDNDKNAIKAYNFNLSPPAILADVRTLQPVSVPAADVYCAGFPCQPFSLAGKKKGFDDSRGGLFFEFLRFVRQNKPKIVFLENVANLLKMQGGRAFNAIAAALEAEGYFVRFKVLNAAEHGNLPQNRYRLFVVAALQNVFPDFWIKFDFPAPIPLTVKLGDIIDFNGEAEERLYLSEEQAKQYKNAEKGFVFKEHYGSRVGGKRSICPTITTRFEKGAFNAYVLKDKKGIRTIALKEASRLQGFKASYCFPPKIGTGAKQRIIGNAVCVPVVRRIAEKIKEILQSK